MENNLQKIAAYQEITRKSGGESLCHSAILRCEYGSKEYVLNLSKSHLSAGRIGKSGSSY